MEETIKKTWKKARKNFKVIDFGTPHQDYNKRVSEELLRVKMTLDLSKNSELDNYYYMKMRKSVDSMLKDLGVDL